MWLFWSGQSPELPVRIHTYSNPNHVRGFSHYHSSLVRANRQLSEFECIVTVSISEASHAITLVPIEPLFSVGVCTYAHCDIVRGRSCYPTALIRAHRQLSQSWLIVVMISSEAPHAITLTLSGLRVDYQSLYMYFTNCHTNYHCRTIYMGNEIQSVLYPLYSDNHLSSQIYTVYTTSNVSSSSITVSGSHCVAPGAFPSQPLIESILSICIARIMLCISGGILSHCSNRSLYVPTQWQICAYKTMICIPLHICASTVTRRKQPPAQLSMEYFTAGAASNQYSAVTSSVKWDVNGQHVELNFVFLKKDFANMPDSRWFRNSFFSIYVDCQEIQGIHGV